MAKPISKTTAKMDKDKRRIAADLALLRNRMINAGLLLTFQASEKALVAIGYEIEAMESGTWPESAVKAIAERMK